MADNETALQNMINEVIKTCKTYGIALNPKITKVMVVLKKESPVITIFAEKIRLEQVKEFKYLGSWITEDGDCLTEIKRRIGVAKSFFWKHKELLKHNISMKLKKMILNIYIFSVVSYGCESWTFNSAIVKTIKLFRNVVLQKNIENKMDKYGFK